MQIDGGPHLGKHLTAGHETTPAAGVNRETHLTMTSILYQLQQKHYHRHHLHVDRMTDPQALIQFVLHQELETRTRYR